MKLIGKFTEHLLDFIVRYFSTKILFTCQPYSN